jgi:hypothetical protein
VTDKSKRPLKKRHASFHQHQPTNRVNKFLAQAIEARSMGQEKSNHVHALTLCFRDSLKEEQVSPSIHLVIILFNFNVDNFCWNCFFHRRTVPTGCGQQFRQFLGWQFGSSRLFGRRPVGRFASNAHSSSPVSDGFRLDGRLAHDVIGRSSPMAPLGCDARLRFPAGHHRFYYRPLMRRRPSQCRTSLLSFIFSFLSSPVL